MPSTPHTPPFKLYNTAARSLQPVTPADPSRVSFYTCGPTVYDDAHIGNFRSFLAADLLRRFLESPLCTLTDDDGNLHTGPRTVHHVMNITDVGHMTDDAAADGGGEDKMATAGQRLEAAKKAGTVHQDENIDPNDPGAISRFYAKRFIEDARKLGLKVAIEASASDAARKELMPFATEHIGGMRLVIEDLLDRGIAYAAGKPGSRAIYFDVQQFSAYGTLSGNTLDKLQSGAGGRVSDSQQSEKRSNADFLLWKEDDTHLMKWAAPKHASTVGWSEGYPGWHIECTAMSLANLTKSLPDAKNTHATIDLHSGGEDNIFPHHECENAQSCAFTGSDTFARHWFHGRFLMVEGKKMSKSAGTFYTPRQLFKDGIEPAAVRLELIKSHYRNNADFSKMGLWASTRQIKSWRRIAKKVSLVLSQDESVKKYETTVELSAVHSTIALFMESLASDLNIAKAISHVSEFSDAIALQGEIGDQETQASGLTEAIELLQEWEKQVDAAELPGSPSSVQEAISNYKNADPWKSLWGALHLIDNILGVIFQPPIKTTSFSIGVFLPGVTPSPEIEQLLLKRADAKKTKDFAAADAIRDQLSAMNLAIKDVAGGRVEVGPA